MPAGTTGIECTLYQPGHQVHWIQVTSSSLPRNPQRGRVVSIKGRLITGMVNRQERHFRNHAPSELRSVVEELGPDVVVDEPRSLLKVPLPDDESLKCFSIVDASKNPGVQNEHWKAV